MTITRTTFPHHYLTQPRDWHGRWCPYEGCGAIDPRTSGLPKRCYSSATYGDPQEYMNRLEQLLNNEITCDQIQQLINDVNDELRALTNAIIDTENKLEEINAPSSLELIGGAIMLGALTLGFAALGVGLAGLLGSALGAAVGTAAAAVPLSDAFWEEVTQLLGTNNQPFEPTPEQRQLMEELFTQFLETHLAGGDMQQLLEQQLTQLAPNTEDWVNVSPDAMQALQSAYLYSVLSFQRSKLRYLSGPLRTTLLKLADDCQTLQHNPLGRRELERRLATMRARYERECNA